MPPIALEKAASEKYALGKQQIKSVIKGLIDKGELIYIYQYGSTFLEKSLTDPCSIAEAKENNKINGLQHRIDICDRAFEKVDRVFSMITANLRYPTIKRLLPYMHETVHKKGFVVFSGIKTDEIEELLDIYKEKDFLCRWKENEQDWAGVVFEKTA